MSADFILSLVLVKSTMPNKSSNKKVYITIIILKIISKFPTTSFDNTDV